MTDAQRAVRRKTHQTVRRATDAFEDRFRLNTVVAALMELTNSLYEFSESASEPDANDRAVVAEAISALTRMLAPFSPHIASELWELTGNAGPLSESSWPESDADLAREDSVEIPVQVNGKLRTKIFVAPDASRDALESAALSDERIRSLVEGQSIAKVVVVPGRLVNVVIK